MDGSQLPIGCKYHVGDRVRWSTWEEHGTVIAVYYLCDKDDKPMRDFNGQVVIDKLRVRCDDCGKRWVHGKLLRELYTIREAGWDRPGNGNASAVQ